MNRTIETVSARQSGDGNQLVDEQLLLSILRPYPRGSGSASTPFQRDMVIQALSVLQREPATAEADTDVAAIRSALKVALYDAGCNNASQIIENEKRVIAFVGHVFQILCEETALTAPVKTLLFRLQIPVIKLALTDFAFFRQPEHPARRLLNALVSVSAGVLDRNDPLFAKLADIVNRLVDAFDVDPAPFEDAYAAVVQAHGAESETIRKIEARFQREARVEARRLAAKRKVVNLLNRYMREVRLPEEVNHFIVKSWAPYMARTYLRLGSQSGEWRAAVKCLREIIAVAASENTTAGAFGVPVNDYFSQLRTALEKADSFREPHTAAFERARGWFIDHFSDSQETAQTAQRGAAIMQIPLAEPARGEDQTQIGIARLLASVPAAFRPGAWFEIYRGEGKSRRRLKLSTVLEETGRILFADRSGRGVLEIELEDFLCDMDAGRSRLLDDTNRFDQALSLVIDSIRAGQARQEAS